MTNIHEQIDDETFDLEEAELNVLYKQLEELTADLISSSDDSPFIKGFINIPLATWVPVLPLCSGMEEEEHLIALEDEAEDDLLVTWLEHPESSYGEGMCVVVFFIESLIWSRVAMYNRARLMQKQQQSEA